MNTLNNILVAIFKIEASQLSNELTMEDIVLWDSLKHMELITTIENELNIELSVDDIMAMISIKAIRDIVTQKCDPIC